MSKCPICKKEVNSLAQQHVDEVKEILKDAKEALLMRGYQHNYEICPTCHVVCDEFSEEEINNLKQNEKHLSEIANNPNFDWLKNSKYFITCELAGYCYEVVGNHKKASLGYKAACDILDNLLLRHVLELKKVKKIDVETLNAEQNNINEALNYLTFLRELVVGHSLAITSSTNALYIYNYISVALDLNAAEEVVPTLEKMKELAKKLGEPHISLTNMLEEKINAVLEATTITFEV